MHPKMPSTIMFLWTLCNKGSFDFITFRNREVTIKQFLHSFSGALIYSTKCISFVIYALFCVLFLRLFSSASYSVIRMNCYRIFITTKNQYFNSLHSTDFEKCSDLLIISIRYFWKLCAHFFSILVWSNSFACIQPFVENHLFENSLNSWKRWIAAGFAVCFSV